MDIFKEIEELKKSNRKAALAIVIKTRGSTPGKISSKMLVYSDGKISGTIGGGRVERDIIVKAQKIINDAGEPQVFEYTLDESYNYMCGGFMAIYVEPLKTMKRVIIFGAGHVGRALTKLLKLMEYYVIIVDDREEFGNRENFPDADEIIIDEFLKSIDKLNLDENSFVVVVTRDHEWDLEITKEVIKYPVKYIGVIGSKKKAEHILYELKNSGNCQEDLQKIYSPIGIPIKSITPAEIGISIAAQIIDINNRLN
jgi:xanthine dehydrogenase accessory factor